MVETPVLMTGNGGLSRQAGGVLAGEVSSAEEAVTAGQGLNQIQQGRRGALNSWALQQMIEFPGPDPPLTVDSTQPAVARPASLMPRAGGGHTQLLEPLSLSIP
ncbi:hypothetical protein DUI87_20635 [Hirundo rustica rustica]|uniref:Uncharacterized protein n=1 Tax=Hirundo rustica rustica TaxID=333673 RepID=A0A3M0JR21_HIRRU|nr:hypothetical protein DUI87_20635 [Hirundo rustica rustica]